MPDKPTGTPALGLELDSKVLKGAEISLSQGVPSLVRFFELPVEISPDTPSNVKPLYNTDEATLFQKVISKSLVVTTLLASETLIRPLRIQLTKNKDIDSVLEFQAEPLLPYSVDEAVVDRIILSKSKESTQLTLIAAKANHLTHHLELWHALDVEPEVISCVPAALAAFSQGFLPADETHFHLHIGFAQTTCVLVLGGKLVAAQATLIGLDALIEAYTEGSDTAEDEFYQLDFASLKKEAPLTKKIDLLRLEVTKHLYALSKHAQGQEINGIFISGEGSILTGFSETLAAVLKRTLLVPEDKPGFDDQVQTKKYAVPIGLALTALPKAEDQVNLRQKSFLYPYPWKRIQRPMAVYLFCCALLAFAIYLFTPVYVANKEASMKRDYVNLLHTINEPYFEFEYAYRTKAGEEEPFPSEEKMNVINFSQQDIERRLNYLEKEIRSAPDLFALYPKTPRVIDVLAWLNTHEHIVGEDIERTIRKPRIEFKSLSYKMVKRPEPTKDRERYQVKVDIEFTTSSPRYAREFHDILLAPNDIIDPKEEVKWNVEKNSYRASFFLQDRTSYPRSRRK